MTRVPLAGFDVTVEQGAKTVNTQDVVYGGFPKFGAITSSVILRGRADQFRSR